LKTKRLEDLFSLPSNVSQWQPNILSILEATFSPLDNRYACSWWLTQPKIVRKKTTIRRASQVLIRRKSKSLAEAKEMPI